jgi:hypothetical protein
VKQTHEFWVADTQDDAIRKVRATLARVGDLKEVVPGKHLTGTVMALGSRLVNVRVSWRADADPTAVGKATEGQADGPWEVPKPTISAPGTTLILTLQTDDESGRAAKNVVERFEDAYRHFHNPDHKPDRVGMLPITIIGIVLVLVLLLVFFLRSPLYQKFFPKMPAHYLADEKQKQEEAAKEKQRKEEMGETDAAGGDNK